MGDRKGKTKIKGYILFYLWDDGMLTGLSKNKLKNRLKRSNIDEYLDELLDDDFIFSETSGDKLGNLKNTYFLSKDGKEFMVDSGPLLRKFIRFKLN